MTRLAVYAGEGWCPTGKQWDLLMTLPCQEEQQRIKRFRFAKDAKLALVGRLLLQHACCAALGVPWGSAELGRTAEGKPFLIRAQGLDGGECCAKPWLNLNLSHHGAWVVLAWEEQHLVGADVMTTSQPRPNESAEQFLNDFQSYFTPSEWAAMRGAAGGDEAALLRAFFTFWALKEAYIKAVGLGLGIDLRKIELTVPQELLRQAPAGDGAGACDGVHLRLGGELQHGWRFQLGSVRSEGAGGNGGGSGEEHVTAVAVGGLESAAGSFLDALRGRAARCGCAECPAVGGGAAGAGWRTAEVHELIPPEMVAEYAGSG